MLVRALLATLLFNVTHKFSMGFKSGEFPAMVALSHHCFEAIWRPVAEVWAGAESC